MIMANKSKKFLLYGGLALGAWWLFSRKANAAGVFTVRNASGVTTGTYYDLNSAQAAAKLVGDATSSARIYDQAGNLVGTYISPAYQASLGGGGSSDPTGNGWDWDPTHSPYFQDVANTVVGFFGF